MKILLVGKNGQVGSALLATLPSLGEVLAADRTQLDLARPDMIVSAVREARPEIIVNAAAYTAVDQAEKEEPAAVRINRDGAAILAEEAKRLGALLVHYSTDYVFDGEKAGPYVESDPPNPLNAYGRSKLAGEQAIQASGCRYLIFRTSWVYSAGGRNFLLTMLRLSRDGKALYVVNDQYGAPTSSMMIARATAEGLSKLEDQLGLYHMTASGQTTWHDFAHAIFRVIGSTADVRPISSNEYKTPARRPRNSVLDNSKLRAHLGVWMPPWEDGLKKVAQTLR